MPGNDKIDAVGIKGAGAVNWPEWFNQKKEENNPKNIDIGNLLNGSKSLAYNG